MRVWFPAGDPVKQAALPGVTGRRVAAALPIPEATRR
jgi:hypothetical protein